MRALSHYLLHYHWKGGRLMTLAEVRELLQARTVYPEDRWAAVRGVPDKVDANNDKGEAKAEGGDEAEVGALWINVGGTRRVGEISKVKPDGGDVVPRILLRRSVLQQFVPLPQCKK